MATRLNEVVRRLAKHLRNIFTGIASTVALTPIPISDLYILLTLQSLLACLIASLSGRDLSLDSAREFIVGVAGATGLAFLFRVVAQQSSKFVNAVFPGAGSAISSGIAALGTQAVGNAAISYYIDGIDFEEVRSELEKFTKREKEADELPTDDVDSKDG